MNLFEFFIELLGGLRIVASPLLGGLIAGGIVYGMKQDTVGLVAGIVIAASGLIIGIVWATRVWKKHGTMQFLSRINASPELDSREENSRKK
jgi:hypothetical protein